MGHPNDISSLSRFPLLIQIQEAQARGPGMWWASLPRFDLPPPAPRTPKQRVLPGETRPCASERGALYQGWAAMTDAAV